MVLRDKFNYRQNEFFADLAKLVSRYMECDGLTVETQRGATDNMIITISVKKVKSVSRPVV